MKGFAAMEIRVLKGVERAQYVCPFAYLDEPIKEETLTKIKALF